MRCRALTKPPPSHAVLAILIYFSGRENQNMFNLFAAARRISINAYKECLCVRHFSRFMPIMRTILIHAKKRSLFPCAFDFLALAPFFCEHTFL